MSCDIKTPELKFPAARNPRNYPMYAADRTALVWRVEFSGERRPTEGRVVTAARQE
jgi:hypothetical protein